MKITWYFAILGALTLIVLLVLLELGFLTSPFASTKRFSMATSPVSSLVLQEKALSKKTPDKIGAAAETTSMIGTLPPLGNRRDAVYKLTQQGLKAKDELAKLVQSPIPPLPDLQNPHSVGSYKHREEVALRVTALEALDTLAVEYPEEIRNILEMTSRSLQDPTLRFFVQVSLEGIYSKRPGKLKRTIDAMMAEKEGP